ncbi:MAG: hypothetical protein WDO17_14685 [Alphaproteobacteria bacterium]
MAKRSKAKAKPTKKKKAKKKAAKKKTIKKLARPADDPCQAQEDAVQAAQDDVDQKRKELEDPDLPPQVRKNLEKALQRAEGKLNAAENALGRCRRQHPGSHPH